MRPTKPLSEPQWSTVLVLRPRPERRRWACHRPLPFLRHEWTAPILARIRAYDSTRISYTLTTITVGDMTRDTTPPGPIVTGILPRNEEGAITKHDIVCLRKALKRGMISLFKSTFLALTPVFPWSSKP